MNIIFLPSPKLFTGKCSILIQFMQQQPFSIAMEKQKRAFYHSYWRSLNFNLLKVSNCYLMLKDEAHKLQNDSFILK